MTSARRFSLPLALALLASCGASRHEALLTIAARDLSCPQDQLTVQSESDRGAAVTGCGDGASYWVLCEPGCGWVLRAHTAP